MGQNFKAVYFSDFPAESAKEKSITLAFGPSTNELYEAVRDLSSEEIRSLLRADNYNDIINSAKNDDLPLNTYCIRQIKKSIDQVNERQLQFKFQETDIQTQLFDPLTVTFKGGEKEPFVRWYPYLQGYSPQFVELIIEEFAQNSKCILDPFAGTGTTAFTASQQNKKSYFCEINPVLQFICLTKIKVRQLNSTERIKLSKELFRTKNKIKKLDDHPIDVRLKESYSETFGTSEFFDNNVYEQILKLRSLLDEISLDNPLLSDLVTIAVVSALIPVSKMKRAGDLRYKTAKELEKPSIPLIEEVNQNLFNMAIDLQNDINGLKKSPVLITESVHSLKHTPDLGIDAVITSPPYVNGTNYFRNTKIELWFLRCLTEKKDLTRFRSEALTAGINDVTAAKIPSCNHPEVEKIVSMLKENAYDSRIPRMIESYFSEISDAFSSIRQHLVNNATVVIDIGDSCYAGIHVPVDRLLSECLYDLGFKQRLSIPLRKRRSKGGMLLKQILLTFSYQPTQKIKKVKFAELSSKTDWENFKVNLPHQLHPFTKRNWGHPLHSLCSYPGKLKPAIAYFLTKLFVPEEGKVLDPFAGSGTIPFEAALQGKFSYGFELNPAAYAVANGKIQPVRGKDCTIIINSLKNFIKKGKPTKQELLDSKSFGFNGKLEEYYENRTLKKVLLARRFFQKYPPKSPEEFFVLASLLHILHGNRPYALSRRSHPITPYKPSGPFEYRPLIERLNAKVQRGLQKPFPKEFKPGKMYLQDATGWWPREIDQLDAIITSPPFFDSTRYYLANWLRLWFAGWSPRDFKGRPHSFVDERQKKSFDVYLAVLRQARERLKSNGVVVFHLGKSSKCDMANELIRLGKRWFRSAEIFDESVAHCESHGIRDKGTVTFHQYLVLY